MILLKREKTHQEKTKNTLKFREESARLTTILRKNNRDEKKFESYLFEMFHCSNSF